MARRGNNTITVTFRLTTEILKQIEMLVKMGVFRNRSAAARRLLLDALDRYKHLLGEEEKEDEFDKLLLPGRF